MQKITVILIVDFYHDGELQLKDEVRFTDNIKNKINGWQYSKSKVMILQQENIDGYAVPGGANRIYKEDLK